MLTMVNKSLPSAPEMLTIVNKTGSRRKNVKNWTQKLAAMYRSHARYGQAVPRPNGQPSNKTSETTPFGVVPLGTTDNSPAFQFQRWVCAAVRNKSRRDDRRTTISVVPTGLN
ncbi:MAG: hypothetical protein C5B50_22720 [Verrucomicrobia bacterium]|nr:MAG: hypothetical protein C5B50_22720 [Verrucomicrobiota bacterium]